MCVYVSIRDMCSCACLRACKSRDRGSKKHLARGAKLTHKRGRNTLDFNRFQHGDDDSEIIRG